VTYYILIGREPVATDDMSSWAAGMTIDRRRVALTDLDGNVSVSTVFLGIDHGFRPGPPVLFESMVFGLESGEQDCWRYATWAAAEAGHEQIVAALRAGRPLDDVDPQDGAR
jgi:hypothetical protein